MSQRAHIRQTPDTHPHLFKRVSHGEVQAGDVYKGTKRSRTTKWYANTEGQGCVDTHRQYFRPTTPIPSSQLGPLLAKKGGGSHQSASPRDKDQQHAAGQPCPAGPMEEDDGEDIPLFTISVNEAALARLLKRIADHDDAQG